MVTPQKNLLVVLWAILLLLISCEFELKNTYEPQRDTDRPPPEILINELSFQEDTIYAYRSQLLTFNFSTVISIFRDEGGLSVVRMPIHFF